MTSSSGTAFYARDHTRPVLFNESEVDGVFQYDIKGNYTEATAALKSELRLGETVRGGRYRHTAEVTAGGSRSRSPGGGPAGLGGTAMSASQMPRTAAQLARLVLVPVYSRHWVVPIRSGGTTPPVAGLAAVGQWRRFRRSFRCLWPPLPQFSGPEPPTVTTLASSAYSRSSLSPCTPFPVRS